MIARQVPDDAVSAREVEADDGVDGDADAVGEREVHVAPLLTGAHSRHAL